MCDVAWLGARAQPAELRSVLSGHHPELELDLLPLPGALGAFPEHESVVSLTVGACSCALLRGLGSTGPRPRAAHVAGVGYGFRRALASATVRFGSIRLLLYRRAAFGEAPPRLRHTSLSQLLLLGLEPEDRLLRIVARAQLAEPTLSG